jgi:hypothetical protein
MAAVQQYLTQATLCRLWGLMEEEQFLPSVGQIVGSAVVVAAFIAAAFAVGRRALSTPGRIGRPVPKPWVVGVTVFAVLGAITFIETALELFRVESAAEFATSWSGVTVHAMLVAALAILIARWSQRKGWGGVHIVCLAGGALLIRAGTAFLIEPVSGDVQLFNKLAYNAVLFLGTVALLLAAALTARRASDASVPPASAVT